MLKGKPGFSSWIREYIFQKEIKTLESSKKSPVFLSNAINAARLKASLTYNNLKILRNPPLDSKLLTLVLC
jgi:hypothetical protein